MTKEITSPPEKIIGWRMEQDDLKLSFSDNRPIVIGEVVSVKEEKNVYKTISVGNYGLHAYKSFLQALNQGSRTYLSLVELSGKMHINDGQMSAESRRCLGILKWIPIFKQLYARFALPAMKKLIKKYPELQIIETVFTERAAGHAELKEDLENIKNFLRLRRNREDDCHMNRKWMGPAMISCGMWEDQFFQLTNQMKAPKEYSAIVDMLVTRLDSAKTKVFTELLGMKVFTKAKKYAEKIRILEKALKDVSDLKHNELPKFFASRIFHLFEDTDIKQSIDNLTKFLLAVEIYDTLDLTTKEMLEQGNDNSAECWTSIMEKNKSKYDKIKKDLYQTVEDEFKKLMDRSLKLKAILTSL
jgi:glutaredoxin-related protein